MDNKPILILGGYGNAGFSIADYLLRCTDKPLVLAGRNGDKARFAAGDLNAGYVGQGWDYRVTGMTLDASNAAAITDACQNASLLVVAASCAEHTSTLLDSLLASHTDALFVSSHPQVQAVLDAQAVRIRQAGLCIISQAGLFPGLPAALLRHYAQQVPGLQKASVSLLRNSDWQALNLSDQSLQEMLDTWRLVPTQVLRKGKWRNAKSWRGDYAKIPFSQCAKAVPCVPKALPELQQLSQQFPELQRLEANLNRFNPFVNWLVLPLLSRTQPEISAKLLHRLRWGLEHFNRLPYGAQLIATLHGRTDPYHSGRYKKTLHLSLSHQNAYDLLGISVAACIKQYLHGKLRQPGLWLQGLSLDTQVLLEDMQQLGAKLEISTEVI